MGGLLSIIIPAYNIEYYIGRCLDSLLNQTYEDLEIIVVDDGSTDNTLSIIKEYCNKDNRITVIHKENEGVSVARLTGMKKAKGEYVGFVDGDDIVEQDMFEFLMNNAKKYNADISHCGYVMDFPDGHSDYYYNTGKIIVQNNQRGLKDLLEGKYIEPGLWNKIYKKKLIDSFISNHNIMDYTIKNLEDLLINYSLFKNSNIAVYEDVCMYHYTLRKSSAATTVRRNIFEDPLKVMKILMDVETDAELHNVIYKRYISALITNFNQKIYKDIAKKSKKILKKELKNYEKYHISNKYKLITIGICYLGLLYKLIRYIYEKITKIDKKYNV